MTSAQSVSDVIVMSADFSTQVGGELQWSSVLVVGAADGGSGLQQESDGAHSIVLGSIVKRSLLVQKSPSLRIS